MLLEVRVPAKVNLSLVVGPRRADGYHELFSVFLPIDLYDSLEFDLRAGYAAEGPRALRVDCETIPGESNLAAGALRSLEKATGWAFDGLVRITKGIPVGAGLGGGSADAAAALRAGARVIAAAGGPTVDEESLRVLGGEIGADVPFFLRAEPSIARGIGDALQPLGLPPLHLVLVFHRQQLSTALVYEEFDRMQAARPGETEDLPLFGNTTRPKADGRLFEKRAAELEKRWQAVAGQWNAEQPKSDRASSLPDQVPSCLEGVPHGLEELLQNDLEKASFHLIRELAGDKDILLDLGALGAVMSGSGPTLLGVCGTRSHADTLASRLSSRGYRVRSVNTGILP